MYPLPVNPTVAILLNPEGKVEAVASNIDSELKVVVVTDRAAFAAEACNKPFDSTRPVAN